MHIALDATAGDDFEPIGRDGAVHATAHHDSGGLDLAFQIAVGTDHHVGLGLNVAVDAAIDVQRVVQGEIADKLGACRDDG